LKKITVTNYRQDPYYARIVKAVEGLLREKGFVAPLELFIGMDPLRHSLATALLKLKVDAKTVQGMLRHEDFGTTMQLHAQSDMESMRDAQGKFLEQLLGDC
jgi:site-specific recombinase XerD